MFKQEKYIRNLPTISMYTLPYLHCSNSSKTEDKICHFWSKKKNKLTTNLRVLTSYITTLIERVPTHYPLHVLYTHTWAKMSLSLFYLKINCCVTITPIKIEIIVIFVSWGYLPCPRTNEDGMSPLKQVVFLTIKWIKWFNLFDNRCFTQ